jgi:hypothetical protein
MWFKSDLYKNGWSELAIYESVKPNGCLKLAAYMKQAYPPASSLVDSIYLCSYGLTIIEV